MAFLPPIIPQTVLRTSSLFSPDIRVVREWGGLKLLVNGSRQSGPYIRDLWKRAVRKFGINTLQNIKNILVLGVGGGTVIDLLAHGYPNAHIIAVDIDPVIISIAKRYFHLDRVPGLRMMCGDAKSFVRPKNSFDLIVVDLFVGREIPSFVSTIAFYTALRNMVRPGGIVTINYLRELTYQWKSEQLFNVLTQVFSKVVDFPIANNRFFLAST